MEVNIHSIYSRLGSDRPSDLSNHMTIITARGLQATTLVAVSSACARLRVRCQSFPPLRNPALTSGVNVAKEIKRSGIASGYFRTSVAAALTSYVLSAASRPAGRSFVRSVGRSVDRSVASFFFLFFLPDDRL